MDSPTAACPGPAILFFQAEDGIRDLTVTGVQTCALPISRAPRRGTAARGRPLLLPRVGRDLSGRLGRRGPDLRSTPGRRGPRAAGEGRSGQPRGAGAPHRAAQARGAMIRLENLTKHYGSFVAVGDISLEVPRGGLYGFLGPDGWRGAEPMVGLDPKAARLLKDIFRQFVGRGGTVLMSTHTLEVAEAMCDRVAILQHGRIVADGAVDDLRRQHRAGDATLEELFLKLTGGAHVRELVEVLGG